jgi:hypothetical protein
MKTSFPDVAPKEIEREIQTLKRDYAEIIKHADKYVLIQGALVVDYFSSYNEAISEGYKRFGLDDFLVKRVRERDEPVRAMRCGVVRADGKIRLTRAHKR